MPTLDPERQERRDEFNELVGHNVYVLRQRKGVSPTFLAEFADMDVSKLHRCENGERAFTAYELTAVAKCLGVSVTRLSSQREPDIN